MKQLYVVDTMSIIYYFDSVFHQPSQLSKKASNILGEAIKSRHTEIRLSIPSVVFIELHEKWLLDEEFVRKFHYEIFIPISESPNIEIKPIEREVVENLINVRGRLSNHELHDKIILSSAIMLNSYLITTDPVLIEYVRENRVIPGIVN